MGLHRRKFLAAGTAAATVAVAERAFGQWQPSQRYPDPSVQIVDQSFARYKLNLAKVERLATGFRWCEGPVWFGDGRYLLWSDRSEYHGVEECHGFAGALRALGGMGAISGPPI